MRNLLPHSYFARFAVVLGAVANSSFFILNSSFKIIMFKDINVLELLPQRPPFVMVDELTDYSETQSSCALTVRSDNVFLEGGCLQAAGLVEHIAQTCAARLGYYNKYVLKTGVRLGFIGEVKDLDIVRLPREGETIKTTIVVMQEIFDVTLVAAEVRVGTETIATTRLKIAQGEESSE